MLTGNDSTGGSHVWLTRFAVRLLRLRPDLTATMAIQRAVLRYPDCRTIEPELAARAYALATKPPRGGRPPQRLAHAA